MLPCTSFRPGSLFSTTKLSFPSLLPSLNQKDKEEKKNQKSHARIFLREQLREQHELTQEIGNAITSMPITEPVDEDELQADLDKLEQEALDEKMLRTGTVPVADSLSNRLPAGPTGASTSLLVFSPHTFFSSYFLNLLPCHHLRHPISASNHQYTNKSRCLCGVFINSQRQIQSRRRRRRSRTSKTPGRDGHVKLGAFLSGAAFPSSTFCERGGGGPGGRGRLVA